MSIFEKMFEGGDLKRDNFCADLQSLGIDSQMAPRGRPEEFPHSLGVIDIKGEPILWVNIRFSQVLGDDFARRIYYADYGIPDSRLGRNSPRIKINTKYVRTFPAFGEVVDLEWKGDDCGLGAIGRLNKDTTLKQAMIEGSNRHFGNNNVSIFARNEYNCWIIAAGYLSDNASDIYEDWICYRLIARRLTDRKLTSVLS